MHQITTLSCANSRVFSRKKAYLFTEMATAYGTVPSSFQPAPHSNRFQVTNSSYGVGVFHISSTLLCKQYSMRSRDSLARHSSWLLKTVQMMSSSYVLSMQLYLSGTLSGECETWLQVAGAQDTAAAP